MATVLGDLMHPSGKYIKDGEEKTRWVRVGVLMRTDNGYRVKMDAFPADCSDSGGWLSVFEKRDDSFRKPAPAPAPARVDLDDDLPF